MSEYLSKKAVLEWLESEMSINKGHPDDIDIHWTLNRVSKKIQSGAFDAHVTQMQTDTTQNDQAIIRQFLNRLDWMAGTGNGIGAATVEKIRQFAIREGFLPPGGANER